MLQRGKKETRREGRRKERGRVWEKVQKPQSQARLP